MGAASLPRVVAGGEEEPSQGNSQVLRDSGRRLKNGLGEAWDWWEGIFFWDWGEVGSEVPKLPAGIVGIASVWCSRDAIFHPVFPRFSPPGTPLQLHLLFPRLFQFLFHLHIHEKIKFCQIIRGFLASEGALEWRGGLQANPAPFHPSLELPGFFGILEFSWKSRLGGVGFSMGSTGLDGNNREWGRSPVVAPGIRAAPAWDF